MSLALTPDDILKMSEEQLTILVTQLQERRMRVHAVWADASEAKRKARKETITSQITRKLDQYFKVLTRIDKDLETLELRMNQIRALKLELEDGGL